MLFWNMITIATNIVCQDRWIEYITAILTPDVIRKMNKYLMPYNVPFFEIFVHRLR